MKEFGIYIRQNGGKPFRIHIFDNFNSCQFKLYEMINDLEDRGLPYFVDNDFFNNKYLNIGKLKYFRIDCREVSEWSKYNLLLEKNYQNKNNIVYLKNFK